MDSILVSGATGFIGQNFIKHSSFRNVISVSLRSTPPESVDFSGIDTVLHLSAIVHSRRNVSPSEYSRVNRDLTVAFGVTAKKAGVRHFIFLSTSKVYGDSRNDFPLKEQSACFPSDDYGRSKYEAEQGIMELNDDSFTVSIIRTPVVYGPGMKANMLNLVRLIKIMPVLPLGGIHNKRNYTYIENLIGFIDRIIKLRKQGIFIAMDTEPISTIRLVNMVSEALNKRIFLWTMPGPMLRISRFLFPYYTDRLYKSVLLDNSETREKLAFEPPYTTGEGIHKTLQVSDLIK